MNGFFNQIWNMMCEDDANRQIDPLRAGFVSGLAIYLAGGMALIVGFVHVIWARHDTDMQNYAFGLAAWGAGLGAMITGAGMGLFGKSKGDAA